MAKRDDHTISVDKVAGQCAACEMPLHGEVHINWEDGELLCAACCPRCIGDTDG